MNVNKDIYMLSFAPDRTGKRAATDIILQYSTPEQWARQNPEAAERQRRRAEALLCHQPFPSSVVRANRQTTRMEGRHGQTQRSEARRHRATVWYCPTPGCPYTGPYAVGLYASCVLGCGQPWRSDHPTGVNGRTEPVFITPTWK